MKTNLKGLIVAAFLCAGTVAVHGQTTPTGQVLAPGAHNGPAGVTSPCPNLDNTTATAAAATDANCAALTPGFAAPSTNTPKPSQEQVTAVIRIDSVVEKPAAFPFPIEFNVVGNATMVKGKTPRLTACYAAGKGWANRSNAVTSTTCLDKKGEVIAYQECKPKTADAPAQCTAVLPKEDGDTVALMK